MIALLLCCQLSLLASAVDGPSNRAFVSNGARLSRGEPYTSFFEPHIVIARGRPETCWRRRAQTSGVDGRSPLHRRGRLQETRTRINRFYTSARAGASASSRQVRVRLRGGVGPGVRPSGADAQ